MRIKFLITLLLSLLVFASLAHAQDATVEPTAEATLEVELIAPVEVTATEEAAAPVEGDHAAEAAPAAEEAAQSESPAGSALLMMLLGIGVVVLVGGATFFMNRSKPQ